MKNKNKIGILLIALSLGLTSCNVVPIPKPNDGTSQSDEQTEPIDHKLDGKSLLTGYGSPSLYLGKFGDSYIDLDTWDFYVKNEYGWSCVGNIKGENANNDTHIYKGKGMPSNYDGLEDDLYIDILTGDLYVFSNGFWKLLGNSKDENKDLCTVHFDTGVEDIVIPDQKVKRLEKIEKPEYFLSRTGYKFINWTYKGEPWSFVGYVVTESMTLVANWSQNKYKIHYDQLNYDEEIGYGDILHLPTCYDNDPHFKGWYYGNTKIENDEPYNYEYDLCLTPLFELTLPLKEYIDNLQNKYGRVDIKPDIKQPAYLLSHVYKNDYLKQLTFSGTKEQFINYISLYNGYKPTKYSENCYWVEQPMNCSMLLIEYHNDNTISIKTSFYDGKEYDIEKSYIQQLLTASEITRFGIDELIPSLKINDCIVYRLCSDFLSFAYPFPIDKLYKNQLLKLGFKQDKTKNCYFYDEESLFNIKINDYDGTETKIFMRSFNDGKDLASQVFRRSFFSFVNMPDFTGKIKKCDIVGNKIIYETRGLQATACLEEFKNLFKNEYSFIDEDGFTKYYFRDKDVNAYINLLAENKFEIVFGGYLKGIDILPGEEFIYQYSTYTNNLYCFDLPILNSNFKSLHIANADDKFDSLYLKYDIDERNIANAKSSYKALLLENGYTFINGRYYKKDTCVQFKDSTSFELIVSETYFKKEFNNNDIVNECINLFDMDMFYTKEWNVKNANVLIQTYFNQKTRNCERIEWTFFGDKNFILEKLDFGFSDLANFTPTKTGYDNDLYNITIERNYEDKVVLGVSPKN